MFLQHQCGECVLSYDLNCLYSYAEEGLQHSQFCYVIERAGVGVAGRVALRNAALSFPFRSGGVLAGPRAAKTLR